MDNEIQELDLINETEEVTIDESQPELDVDKLKETNSKLYARAKQAEKDKKELLERIKALENKDVPSTTNNQNFVSREDLDLAILKTAKGYDDEEIEQLQVISKGKGISLIQAQEDALFKLLIDKKTAERKAAKAKLGASNGSSQTQVKKIKEMSREEHMAYVKEMMNN